MLTALFLLVSFSLKCFNDLIGTSFRSASLLKTKLQHSGHEILGQLLSLLNWNGTVVDGGPWGLEISKPIVVSGKDERLELCELKILKCISEVAILSKRCSATPTEYQRGRRRLADCCKPWLSRIN